MTDREDLFRKIPEEVCVIADSGFQGADKLINNILIPKKRKKGEKYRNHKPMFYDAFNLITSGLWNFHIDQTI